MRPAHQAREVQFSPTSLLIALGGFNEARASSTGSIRRKMITNFGYMASMRPAHQAREVVEVQKAAAAAGLGFNEARASSTGSKVSQALAYDPDIGFNEARASSTGSSQ